MTKDLERILNYLQVQRGFDFSGYRSSLIERRLNQRLMATKATNFKEYLFYLENHLEELNNLIEVLTINVSRFFRNPLIFEYMAEKIFPSIVSHKLQIHAPSLRIWSTGCSTGEEPYSMAILLQELQGKEPWSFNLSIFATDIDQAALQKAQRAIYSYESIKEVKYKLLKKYFIQEGDVFTLLPQIKKRVNFSFYDMLDRKNYVPPESVYGDFDLVLCRNLLIYFTMDYQEIIFNKLFHSLAQDGYLVLGKAEVPTIKHQKHFLKLNDWSHIYQKVN